MKYMKKFVITGGPCGGKSDAIVAIKEHFTSKGWKVLVTPETPTDLISGGVAPWTCGSYFQYQLCQMDVHQKIEEVFVRAAKGMSDEKIMIIYDRGQFDCKAYMSEEEFDFALDILHINKDELLDSYDAIFHLQSVSVKYPEIYDKEKSKNPTRIEDACEAAELDKKTLNAWRCHKHAYLIDSTYDFQDKIRFLLKAMESFLDIYQ